jgi:hypothetical protein
MFLPTLIVAFTTLSTIVDRAEASGSAYLDGIGYRE